MACSAPGGRPAGRGFCRRDRARPLRPWVLSIAVNRCRTWLGKRAKAPVLADYLDDAPDRRDPRTRAFTHWHGAALDERLMALEADAVLAYFNVDLVGDIPGRPGRNVLHAPRSLARRSTAVTSCRAMPPFRHRPMPWALPCPMT